MADHLDDRRSRSDDRFDRPGGNQNVEEGQGGGGARLVEAEDVDRGEDQQPAQRHDERGRDAACEMVERRHLRAVDMGLGG